MPLPAGLELVDLETAGLEDFDMGCDYDDDAWHMAITHEHGPARWIARARCEECSHSGTRLICTSCKSLVISTDHGMSCAKCGTVACPARRAFTSFEPLEKR